MLPVPHRGHDNRHRYPRSRNDVTRYLRRRLGDLLAACRFFSGTDTYRYDFFSHVLYRPPSGETQKVARQRLLNGKGHMEALEGFKKMALQVVLGNLVQAFPYASLGAAAEDS